MPEEEKKDKPDLDAIAEKLANMEEEHKLDQILPSVLDTFYKYSKYEKDGKTFYKTEFSDEEKDKMADAIVDALSYHLHVRWYNMTKEEWEERKNKKNPLGETEADTLVRAYLGIDREGLKKMFKLSTKITSETIINLAQNSKKTHEKYIKNKITQDLSQEHTDYIKKWINDKVKKYNLDPELNKAIDKYTKIDEVIDPYIEIAQAHYKKK